MKIRLERVHYMPKVLEPGVLYVSEAFGAAAHLCPCGCGSKIRTPLGPTDWRLEETAAGPTLRPSVGNWQIACRSHYWIWGGEVRWSYDWSEEEIAEGRRKEQERANAYYGSSSRSRKRAIKNFWSWIRSHFGQ